MILSRTAVKHIAILSGLTITLTLAFWFGLWFVGAIQYRSFINNWIEAHRTLGYSVAYGQRETVGFPFHITLHYTDFDLQNPDGIRVHAHDVSLSAFPWTWNRLDAKLKHGFELTIPFTGTKILSIATELEVRNHTELDKNGDWMFVDLHMQKARALWGVTPFFSADGLELALQRPQKPPKDRHDVGLTFTAKLGNLIVPEDFAGPFGPKVEVVDVALKIMGPVPDPRRKDSVAAWTAAYGSVDYEYFNLTWGPLLFASHGTLGLDDDLQPEGAFSAQIGNHSEVLKVLMDKGIIPVRQTGMLDSALSLFTKKVTVDGKPGIEAPMAVQLGGLFLGPVKVFGFPDIHWGDDDASAVPSPNSAAP